VSGVGDPGDAHVRARLEHVSLVVGDSDVIVLPVHDPRGHARIGKTRGERAVAVEVLEIQMGLLAEEVRVVLLQLGDECFAAGRRQAALHGRADDLQHQRIGQVPEYPAEAVQRAREYGFVPA